MPSMTLTLYLSKRYLLSFLGFLFILWSLVYLFDTIEILKRSDNISYSVLTIMKMGLFKLPEVGQQVIPFAVLFGALFTFWQLTKSQELVVIRSAGMSVWQFMLPLMLSAFLIGLFHITVIDTVGSSLLSHYQQWELKTRKKKTSAIELADSGLWLRQIADDQDIVIHADTIEVAKWRLKNVMILFFDKDDRFTQRIDAPYAILADKHWIVENGALTKTDQADPALSNYYITTDITPKQIEERFAKPETIPLWQLPKFMNILRRAGLSVTGLKMHFQTLLAQPFLYAMMVLLAASFALRMQRAGYVLVLILSGLLAGFAIFLLRDITGALGAASVLPTLLAAWAPGILTMCLGGAALLYLEDG